MNLQLIRPCIEFEDSFREGLSEFHDEEGKLRWMYMSRDNVPDITLQDFSVFVQAHHEREHTPVSDFVTTVCFWAILDDEVVGRISFRHELNDYLRKFGGHIGYVVRPSFRRRGIATAMLGKILQEPESIAVGKLLITCDEDNEVSEKVIVRNGGVFESVIQDPPHAAKKRFWINLSKG